jgi:hypothetical protein
MPTNPHWAPRVKQVLIRRLYETDARGIYGEELIDEVGFALLARCENFIAAVEAMRGKVTCPDCGETIFHDRAPDTVLLCMQCSWQMSWPDYFHTFQHKQLSGAEPVLALFRAYIDGFRKARAGREKMVLIDQLIHGFHLSLLGEPTRTTGVNLIEGNYHEVVYFLDELSYGEASTPGMYDLRSAWRDKINRSLISLLPHKPPEVFPQQVGHVALDLRAFEAPTGCHYVGILVHQHTRNDGA